MDPTFPKSLEYIPMLWGNSAEHTSNWVSDVNQALSRGTTHLLAFNEPDKCSGGGSSVSNGPTGLPWLTQFLKLCTGCHIDFIPIHWYDEATNVAYFKSYIGQVKTIARDTDKVGKPICIYCILTIRLCLEIS
ncbi:hypothetical protein EG329_008669 [Mollisiaceae sp. DMI_Dod_QoI]|nr:hypothetical protein EG329_008669 [Helotiales sp. DMI_Dod_QoI]